MAKTNWKNENFSLSTGNTKLIDTIVWSIPARSTCPGATKQCAMHCYAWKAQRQYTNTMNAREKNFLSSKEPTFALDLIDFLEQKLKRSRKTYKYFRIHESGDFYSQEYLDNWALIAQHFPDIQFLAFTKSHHLDFSEIMTLPNVTIRYSVWEDTKHLPNEDMPRAIMEGVDHNPDTKTFKCRPGFNCDTCRFCWVAKDADVQFTLH